MIKILAYAVVIAAMIALIPLIQNDLILASLYVVLILLTLAVKKQKNDIFFLIFGFIALFLSEYFFISTGVETFTRRTLLGIMPLWLPFLWAYAFMIIARCIRIVDL